MDDNSIFSAITDLVLFYIKRVSDLVHLAALEAQLALRTLVVIAILIFITTSLLTVCWASLLTFIFFYLVSIQFSNLLASGIIFFINVIVLATIVFAIYKIKDNLFFPATTKQLSEHNVSKLETKHEQITTKN